MFRDDGKYSIRKHLALSSYGSVYMTSFDSKFYVLPQYNFKYRFSENWYLKDFVPVLLVHPICHQIRQRVQRDVLTLKTLIHAYANSGIGCPRSSADYTSGGGCGYAYTNGSMQKQKVQNTI